MQTPINNSSQKNILLAALGTFFCLLLNIQPVLSAGGDDTTQTSTTQDSSVTSPTIQNAGALTVTPTTLQQTGTNNFANVNPNVGALNYLNCSSSCFFGILRTMSNSNLSGTISNQLEAIIGVIIAIDSPERANSETNRMIVEIQKSKNEYKIKLALGEKLADAIELGKMERAKIVAMLLAPLLGKTHNQLLAEIFAKS